MKKENKKGKKTPKENAEQSLKKVEKESQQKIQTPYNNTVVLSFFFGFYFYIVVLCYNRAARYVQYDFQLAHILTIVDVFTVCFGCREMK